jgi:hypothetical protein
MSTGIRSAAPLPWYRHPLVWLIIAFPALSVAGGLATLWIATATFDGLVADDYYRTGLEINRRLERDRAAAALELRAEIDLPAAGGGNVRIVLSGNERFHAPEIVHVRFLHRTRSGMDHESFVYRQEGTVYEGSVPELAAGNWHVLLEADDWRLVQDLRLPGPAGHAGE